MKKILSYAAIGIFSAGTMYGIMEYTRETQHESTISTVEEQNTNGKFATYNYASGGTTTPDFTSAADKSVNAVVSIKNYSKKRNYKGNYGRQDPMNDFFEEFFGQPRQRQQQQQQSEMPTSAGSGVIISADGLIVTNNHVIADAEKLEVTLNNQQTYKATLVGTDPNTDIALIQIDKSDLPFLSFYNSDQLKVGEWVLAVGNPFGLNSTVTAGIVSAKGRGIGILRQNSNHPIESFIQTDAAINPGNSGGALVNTNGHLVGINTAIYSQTGSYAGYGFAVPANLVKKIINDLKSYGRVQRGYVGIRGFDLSDEMAVKSYNSQNDTDIKTGQGVFITDLEEDGGAMEAGLEEGDIIKKVNEKEITSFSTLSLAIGSKNPGDKVNVTILRDGKERSYNVTLKDLNGNAKIRSVDDLTVAEKLGAKFEPLTAQQKVRYGIDKGVLVSKVEANGKLSSIGISEGYIILKINNKEVDSGDEINKILKKYKGNVSVNFVDRSGRIYTQGFTMK